MNKLELPKLKLQKLDRLNQQSYVDVLESEALRTYQQGELL